MNYAWIGTLHRRGIPQNFRLSKIRYQIHKMNEIRRNPLYHIFRKKGGVIFAKYKYFKIVHKVTSLVARFRSF